MKKVYVIVLTFLGLTANAAPVLDQFENVRCSEKGAQTEEAKDCPNLLQFKPSFPIFRVCIGYDNVSVSRSAIVLTLKSPNGQEDHVFWGISNLSRGRTEGSTSFQGTFTEEGTADIIKNPEGNQIEVEVYFSVQKDGDKKVYTTTALHARDKKGKQGTLFLAKDFESRKPGDSAVAGK